MARNPLPSIASKLVDVEVAAAASRRAPTAELVASGANANDGPYASGVSAAAQPGEVVPVPGQHGHPHWLIGVGDGERAQYRAAGAALVRSVDAHIAAETEAGRAPARTVQLRLGADAQSDTVAQLATGVLLGGYRYTVSAQRLPSRVRTVRLVRPSDSDEPAWTEAVHKAGELARACALARDLANTPSNVKDPAWFAGTVQRMLAHAGAPRVTVRDENWLAQQRFGGVLAVGGSSARPPRLIELTYRPRQARTHLLLVGKGITFDTGGLSVKPADDMHLMRTDMAGGGAVVAAMRSIAALRLPVRVTALMPAAENHMSGSGYRPGDIVRHHGGTTTEVVNTDAEGRMVLADALEYGIRRFNPDAVVDAATLTGGMKVTLGTRIGGLFASDGALAERVRGAGERVGERWWRMPLLDAHAESVRGEFADVRQVPPGPSAITAALFLREFTAGLPWAHLDIAGPARAETCYQEMVPGGTGFAARTLVELAASYG